MGTMLAFCVLVGAGLGVLLDRWLGSRPWFTLGMTVLGIVAGFYNVARLASALSGKDKRP